MQVFAIILGIVAVAYAFGVGWIVLGVRRSLAQGLHLQRRERPSVTVVLPVRNEERAVAGCLESLAKQDYPPELWELIVVDDDSDDSTRRRVLDWHGRIPQLRALRARSSQGAIGPKKNALLTAIRQAKGEVVLTTDADARLGPRWIRTMVAALGSDVAAVVGPVFLRGPQNSLHRFMHVESLANAVISCGGLGWGVGISCIGANFGYTRQAFDKVGGFGPAAKGTSGDDDLLLQRFTRSGLEARFVTAPGARAVSAISTTLGGFWSRRRRHLSAARRYPLALQLAGAGWFLYSGMIVVGVILGALARVDLMAVAVGGWLWKAALEMAAVRYGSRAFREPVGWRALLLAVAIHPWLLAVAAPASMLGKVSWRGRRLKA